MKTRPERSSLSYVSREDGGSVTNSHGMETARCDMGPGRPWFPLERGKEDRERGFEKEKEREREGWKLVRIDVCGGIEFKLRWALGQLVLRYVPQWIWKCKNGKVL